MGPRILPDYEAQEPFKILYFGRYLIEHNMVQHKSLNVVSQVVISFRSVMLLHKPLNVVSREINFHSRYFYRT